MTDDIVTRLREQVDCSQQLMCYAPRRRLDRLSHEAADEIERLRERRDDWRAAMTENHDLWNENERLRATLQRIMDYGLVSSADLERALAVLEGEASDDAAT